MTECNGCGGCCHPVVLPITQRQARMTLPDDEGHARELAWIANELEPMPFREGKALAPYLFRKGVMFGVGQQAGLQPTLHFYRCPHYDTETKQCLDYDNRPPVCRGFPWYDLEPDERAAICLPDECSFIEDVPVTLRRKP